MFPFLYFILKNKQLSYGTIKYTVGTIIFLAMLLMLFTAFPLFSKKNVLLNANYYKGIYKDFNGDLVMEQN